MNPSMPQSIGGGSRRWVPVAFGLFAAATVATRVLPGDAAATIAFITLASGLIGAGWLLVADSRSLSKSERRAWNWLGIGLIIAAAGLVFHAIAWVAIGNVPTFGPIDLFWLVGYALGATGIALLPHTAGSKWERLRLLLDGLIGAIAIGTLLWTWGLQDLAIDLEALPIWTRTIGTSYVLLDVTLLIILVTVVIKRSALRFDRRLVFIGMALVAQGTADYLLLTKGLGQTFNDVEPEYALHMIAAAMFFAVGVNVAKTPSPREYAVRSSPPAWALLIPYGLVAVLILTFMVTFPTTDQTEIDKSLLYATILLGVLIILRQGVAIRETRRSLDHQRGDLAASISHELRTPLTTMVGFLELLDAEAYEDAAERREMISIANSQAAYLSRVVSDLVMLASDAGPLMDLRIEAVPIEELTWCAVDAASVDTSRVSVAVGTEITAFIDESRMQQALASLLNNAARYGGGAIEVVADATGGDLVLEVHDDGPGVPRRHEIRIWEKFERGPHHLNSAVPGSGIGLAVTSEIIKAHGGAAGYRRSNRLGGACFWLRLPGRIQIDVAARDEHFEDLGQAWDPDAKLA